MCLRLVKWLVCSRSPMILSSRVQKINNLYRLEMLYLHFLAKLSVWLFVILMVI